MSRTHSGRLRVFALVVEFDLPKGEKEMMRLSYLPEISFPYRRRSVALEWPPSLVFGVGWYAVALVSASLGLPEDPLMRSQAWGVLWTEYAFFALCMTVPAFFTRALSRRWVQSARSVTDLPLMFVAGSACFLIQGSVYRAYEYWFPMYSFTADTVLRSIAIAAAVAATAVIGARMNPDGPKS